MGQQNPKDVQNLHIFLGGPMGLIHPVCALAAIHPRWGNRVAAARLPVPSYQWVTASLSCNLSVFTRHDKITWIFLG